MLDAETGERRAAEDGKREEVDKDWLLATQVVYILVYVGLQIWWTWTIWSYHRKLEDMSRGIHYGERAAPSLLIVVPTLYRIPSTHLHGPPHALTQANL